MVEAKGVLIAAPDTGAQLIGNLLPEKISRRYVQNLVDAISSFASCRSDLVLIDISFDNGKMFDLLKHIHGESGGLCPVICFRSSNGCFLPAGERVTALAVRSLGGLDYWDVSGEAMMSPAQAALRQRLQNILCPESASR